MCDAATERSEARNAGRRPVPGGKSLWYQKHMAHHLLPGVDRGWFEALTHTFLIREPREMLTSLKAKLGPPRLEDTGLQQQVEIFRWMEARTGRPPPVIDSRDVLEDPPGVLRLLCETLGIEFTDRMLSWPAGRRPTDGIWASHWYDAVEKTTGFAPYSPKDVELTPDLVDVHERCHELYAELHTHRLH